MKTKPPPSAPPGSRTWLFGAFFSYRDPNRLRPVLGVNWPRLALVAVVTAVGGYLLAVTAGYAWLRWVRGNDRVTFSEVALLRRRAVRRAMAADQFALARRESAAGNLQAAYLAFVAGLRNDPDSVAGRLDAADFFGAVGATNLQISLLEDGLARAPDDGRLIERTFSLLLATGREQQALTLLRGSLAGRSGPQAAKLRTYEVEAALAVEGVEAAQRLLTQYPELEANPDSIATVARVRWAAGDRLRAIERLSGYMRTGSRSLAAHQQLVRWQEAVGLTDDARETARQACEQFPDQPEARVLLIEALAPVGGFAADSTDSRRWRQEVASFIGEYGGRPEALGLLSNLAARRGWAELARTLYAVAAVHRANLTTFALDYSDALMRSGNLAAARRVLGDLEVQAPEGNAAFMIVLRDRQVELAAALGDDDGVREAARRLVTALGSDATELERLRRRFTALGITSAVAEFGAAPRPAKGATPR